MTCERIPGCCRRCSRQAISGPLLAVALLMAFAYPAGSHGGEPASTDCPQNRKQDIHHCHSEFKSEEPFSNASALPPEKLEGVTLEGLTVAPEHRCSRYDRDDYPFPSPWRKGSSPFKEASTARTQARHSRPAGAVELELSSARSGRNTEFCHFFHRELLRQNLQPCKTGPSPPKYEDVAPRSL